MKRKKGRKQYLCIKQQLKRLTKEEYLTLRELCHATKSLYNEGLYSVRQHFFRTGGNKIMRLIKEAFSYTGIVIPKNGWESYDLMNQMIIDRM